MAAIIINILIGLLVQFLTTLFETWIKNRRDVEAEITPLPPPSHVLFSSKADFLNLIDKKWWLGPKRLIRANYLFENMLENAYAAEAMGQLGSSQSAQDWVSQMTYGIRAGVK